MSLEAHSLPSGHDALSFEFCLDLHWISAIISALSSLIPHSLLMSSLNQNFLLHLILFTTFDQLNMAPWMQIRYIPHYWLFQLIRVLGVAPTHGLVPPAVSLVLLTMNPLLSHSHMARSLGLESAMVMLLLLLPDICHCSIAICLSVLSISCSVHLSFFTLPILRLPLACSNKCSRL